MMMLEDLRSIVAVGIVVVVSVTGLQVMLVEPLRTEAATMRSEARGAQAELDKRAAPHGTHSPRLDERRARAQLIVSKTSQFNAMAIDALTIHETHAALGHKHGLDIHRMEPLSQDATGDNSSHQWQSFRIEANGTYEDVARFVIDLENQEALSRLDQLRVTAQDAATTDQVLVSIIITYSMPEHPSHHNSSNATAEVQEQ